MLLFSLTIHPHLQKITRECRVTLNRWYADDGTLVGPVDDVARTLRLLTTEGPLYNFQLNATKTRAFWPTTSAHQIANLERVLPFTTVTEGGIELLGAPIGSDEFIRSRLRTKLSECRQLLTTLDDIPDARIKFHLHRVTASACRAQYLFKLVPPNLSYSFAQEFDRDQLQAYSQFNLVSVSPTAAEQIGLRIRDGGHGFISIARVAHASYAASPIASARLRVHDPSYPHANENFYRRSACPTLHTVASMLPPTLLPENYLPYVSDLGALKPASLLQRPEGVHTFLFQALRTHAARCYWEDALWERYPDPSMHSAASIRLRARRNSIYATGATQFLAAHPHLESQVCSAVWSVMLRRHLGLPVHDDSAMRLTCPHCQSRMDHLGDHSSICRSGFGVVHRHNMVRNVFARELFRPAGLSAQLEAPLFIPGTNLRPADILVQPSAPPPSAALGKPIAYDITVRSPYTTHAIRRAASLAADTATSADEEKLRTFERAIRGNLSLTDTAAMLDLGSDFVPLAVDTLGAPSERVVTTVQYHARQISMRSASTAATAATRIWQKLSFAVWSSVAAAIFARMPVQADTQRL